MSELGDAANAVLNAIGIESLEDKIEAQRNRTNQKRAQELAEAEHRERGGYVDSEGHFFRGSNPVFEVENEVSKAQTGDPRQVGGPGYVQVGVNEFIPEYTGGLLSPEAQSFFDQDDYGYSGGAFTKDGVDYTAATDDWSGDAWGGVDPGGGYYDQFDDRDDSPMIYQCEQAGGTWVNGACEMPKADTSAADKDAELEDFINSFDPFTSIKRAKWIHPLQGYETSNLWDYKPPQIEDWTPGLRDWAGV